MRQCDYSNPRNVERLKRMETEQTKKKWNAILGVISSGLLVSHEWF